MYEITIKHKEKGRRTYKIFTQKEADEKGIEYKPWRDAEIGEYALSDDNFVAIVIQRKEYKANNGVHNYYIRLPFGYAFYSPKYPTQKLKAEGRLSNQTLSGKPQLEVRKGSTNWKNLALAYSTCFNMDLAIDMVFDRASPNQRRTYKRWMRTQEFKSMTRDELKGVLDEKGYGESDVIDLLSKGMKMAKDKGDVTNFLRVVENIQDMLGMKDKNIVKTTHTLEAHTNRKILDEIAEEEAVLKAKKEVIEPKDE
jgi:hypothetical protein